MYITANVNINVAKTMQTSKAVTNQLTQSLSVYTKSRKKICKEFITCQKPTDIYTNQMTYLLNNLHTF